MCGGRTAPCWPVARAAGSRPCRGGLAAFGDIHTIANALSDASSISIHVYGGNIGRISRSVFDPITGEEKPFVSGYSNATTPNLWTDV